MASKIQGDLDPVSIGLGLNHFAVAEMAVKMSQRLALMQNIAWRPALTDQMRRFAAMQQAVQHGIGHSFSMMSLPMSNSIRDDVDDKVFTLRKELREMKERAERAESQTAEEAEQRSKLIELLDQQRLQNLFGRVHPDSYVKLKDDEGFRNTLTKGSTKAFVMSIDLRRSTELMLKARSPELFADFIQSLAESLRSAVLEEFGVFDKFTGDGILAFFPIDFSGVDAGYRVIRAASRCHSVFSDLYKNHRKCFDVILKDVGLGIGIDFGPVNIATIGDLTVVGTPVVYACRLGAAPAGHTYLNQTAYEEVSERYDQNMLFEETSLDFKHEGAMVAYDVQLSHVGRFASKPDWATEPNTEASATDQSLASESPQSEVSSSENA